MTINTIILLNKKIKNNKNQNYQKPVNKQPDDKKPADKKPDDKKPDVKKPDVKKPDGKKPDDKKPADKKPADKKPADKKPDDKKPADKKPDDKKPADKKPDDKKPADKKPDDKKPDDKKPDDKKPDDKKSDNKKPDNKKPNNNNKKIFLKKNYINQYNTKQINRLNINKLNINKSKSTGELIRLFNKLKNIFPLKRINDYYYNPLYGIKPCNINMPSEFIYQKAKIYFNILDFFKLEYAVFAGQSIGMLRDKKNIPWVDDFDIILFSYNIKKFMKIVIPLLEKNNYKINIKTNKIRYKNLSRLKYSKLLSITYGFQISSKAPNSRIFLCDVFVAINSNNILEGVNKDWGIYSKAKIPISSVLPFKRLKFDYDLELPFFNNIINEVKLTYGCIKTCIISTHSHPWKIKYDNWNDAYKDFNYVKNYAITNTKNKININKKYDSTNKLVINKNHIFKNDHDLLIYINIYNIGTIYVFDNLFLIKYVLTIKYYYPEINIEFFSYDKDIEVVFFLNSVNILHVKNQEIYDYYNDNLFFYINKPKIDMIRLITFGTFDLFHIGHQKIFERCLEYSDHIIVGISSDNFTFEKKQIIPTDNFETREKNVIACKNVKEVFSEESMELKNTYIKEKNANILVMGDDWKNKFDWVDCCVIYLERTPDISSTLLREQLKNIEI